MKQGKSSGPDEIPTEMLSALEGLRNDLLWNLIDKIYEMEIFLNDILKSLSITLPSIPGTLDCSNQPTISLISHILKIHACIYAWMYIRMFAYYLTHISQSKHEKWMKKKEDDEYIPWVVFRPEMLSGIVE